MIFFFFSSRRRHTRYWRDWSSDVCSSDLVGRIFTKNPIKIKKSLDYALSVQQTHNLCRNDKGYLLKVAVVGHPYNIFDKYINMNLLNKLNKLGIGDRKSTRLNSSHANISYAVFCLKKKKN